MSETYSKEYCPECKSVNWICLGDLDDCTARDVEGVECHKCGHKWLFIDLGEFLLYHKPFESEEDENEWYEHHRVPAHMKTKEGMQKLLTDYGFIKKGKETP